jgi:trans-aconitate methyltransferase
MTAPAFDSHADDYETDCMRGLSVSGESKEFFARGRLDYLVRVLAERRTAPPARIVDFGCGVGDVSALLAEVFPAATVLGVDPSTRCVERARGAHASPRVSFDALKDAEAARQPADLIHVNGVLHHVPPADRPALVASLRQWVTRDGVLAVFENNPINPGTRLVMSRIHFDRDAQPLTAWTARALLKRAGFRILETGYLFYFPRPLKAFRPLERFLTRVPLGAQYGLVAVPN